MPLTRRRKRKRDEIDKFFDKVRDECGVPLRDEEHKKRIKGRYMRILTVPKQAPSAFAPADFLLNGSVRGEK